MTDETSDSIPTPPIAAWDPGLIPILNWIRDFVPPDVEFTLPSGQIVPLRRCHAQLLSIIAAGPAHQWAQVPEFGIVLRRLYDTFGNPGSLGKPNDSSSERPTPSGIAEHAGETAVESRGESAGSSSKRNMPSDKEPRPAVLTGDDLTADYNVFEYDLSDLAGPHRLTKLFPEISLDEYQRLLADIRVHGVRVPIIIDLNTNKIIDGRYRVQAAEECGHETIPAIPIEFKSDAQRLSYIYSANLHRRYLSVPEYGLLLAEFYVSLQMSDEEVAAATDGYPGSYAVTELIAILREDPALFRDAKRNGCTLQYLVQRFRDRRARRARKGAPTQQQGSTTPTADVAPTGGLPEANVPCPPPNDEGR